METVKLLLQNGDALRLHEFSVSPETLGDFASGAWIWTLWGIAFLVLILFISVNSLNDQNLVARFWSFLNGNPGRDLFYKFPFEIISSPGNGNVATLPGKPRTGYLRYIDLSRVRFFTNVFLPKGQVIRFSLNTLPGFLSEEPAELECVVRACDKVRPGEQRYYVEARILRLEPPVRGVLNQFLDSLHSSSGSSQRA